MKAQPLTSVPADDRAARRRAKSLERKELRAARKRVAAGWAQYVASGIAQARAEGVSPELLAFLESLAQHDAHWSEAELAIATATIARLRVDLTRLRASLADARRQLVLPLSGIVLLGNDNGRPRKRAS